MHYVYVIKSKKNGRLYIGCTSNLKRRLTEHNKGLNPSSKPYAPYKLIYFEFYINQKDAYSREKILKGKWGKKYLQRVLKNYINSCGCASEPA